MRVKLALLIILLIAAVLRIYKLDQIPPALNWDEAAAGYNAYSIANWGKDEWGRFFPIVFTSFRDDKHPIHVYITAVFVRLLGLSEFSTRLSSAIIGVLTVFVIFYLAQNVFKNNLAAIFTSLFLAVSPYHIHFSRGLWEANFALFFFILGLLLFYMALQKKAWLLNFSFLSFGLSFFSYHSSKIVIPPILLLLILLYFKDLKKLSKNFYTSILILIIIGSSIFIDPRILGIARAKQTQYTPEDIGSTEIYKKTNNSNLALIQITATQYLSHFNTNYLFISGAQNPRNSVKSSGEFYKVDAIFILLGLFFLPFFRSRFSLIIIAWIILAPIPASLVKDAPSAVRAIFMIGCLHLIGALGVSRIIDLLKGNIKKAALIFVFSILAFEVFRFVEYYFTKYPLKDPHEWQYGMKQAVEHIKENEYGQVVVTDIRSQPYIFFLYYLKYPLPKYLETVIYNNNEEDKKDNMVSNFGNFYFGGWDVIESKPEKGVLYIVTLNEYQGLRHKSFFEVKKIIRNPNGEIAFYLVSAI